MISNDWFLPIGSLKLRRCGTLLLSVVLLLLLLRIKAALGLLYPPPDSDWLLFTVHSFYWSDWHVTPFCRSATEQNVGGVEEDDEGGDAGWCGGQYG